MRAVAPRVLQSLQNGHFFELFQRHFGEVEVAVATADGHVVQEVEELRPKDWLARKHHRLLHGVLQLAHVAGPVVLHHQLQGPLADAFDPLAILFGVFLDEVLHKQRNVLTPFAQRRQMNGHHVEAEIQVLTETPLANLLPQVPVRRSDDPHVHLHRLRRAHALELALLQHPKQLGLQPDADLADLVQEERTPVGQLEPAFARFVGAGESALFVAEQFAFDQPLGQGCTVRFNEGLVAPGAVVVDCPRHKFFPRTALPGDQHRGTAVRHHPDALENILHHFALANQRLEAVGLLQFHPKPPVLAHEFVVVEVAVERVLQVIHVQRFLQVVVRTPLNGGDRAGNTRVGGDDDYAQIRIVFAGFHEDVEAAQVGQLDVAEHKVVEVPFQQAQTLAAGRRLVHATAAQAQHLGNQILLPWIILNQQYSTGHVRSSLRSGEKMGRDRTSPASVQKPRIWSGP